MVRAIWAVKRAHWRCWAAARRLLRKARVTPARLDLLQCLATHGGTMTQKAVQGVLGVVRSTVSEALAKVEKLGFVTRGRRTRSGRTVTLTKTGQRALDDAYEPQTLADDRLESALGSDDMARTLVLERLCRRLRVAFGDPSWGALYDWVDYEW